MRLSAWVDGGARGNPGPAGYGVLFRDDAGRAVLSLWEFLGEATNNVAEYRGLIAALAAALELGATDLVIRTDSELVQRQMAGVYKVRQPHLRELVLEARALAGRFDGCQLVHVPREENREADRLVNRAIDERAGGRQTAGEAPGSSPP